jgi:hypothetical protein
VLPNLAKLQFKRLFARRAPLCRVYISAPLMTYRLDVQVLNPQCKTSAHTHTQQDLAALLQEVYAHANNTDVTILIGAEYCRLFMLPATQTFHEDLLDARITARFSSLFPTDPVDDFSFKADREIFNTPRLVVGIRKTILQDIEAAFKALNRKASRITALTVDVWNSVDATLGERNLRVQETHQDTLLMQHAGQLYAIQQRPHTALHVDSSSLQQNAWLNWPVSDSDHDVQIHRLLSYGRES